MIIRINMVPIAPIPPDFFKNLKSTLDEIDCMYVDGRFVNHVAQFYGVDSNREAQVLYDAAVKEEINRHSIIAAAKIKAYLSVHVFDLHNLANHMHDILGMTN